MKRLSIFHMAAIMAALVLIATNSDLIKDNVIDFDLTSADAETMNTFPFEIPNDNHRLCATKNDEKVASAQYADGLSDGFQNDFTAECIPPNPDKLMYTGKQLEDSRTLCENATTSASGAFQTEFFISNDGAHVMQTSLAPDIFLAKSYQTLDLTHSSLAMSRKTITFYGQNPLTNANVLVASNGVKANSGTGGGTTPVFIFSRGTPVSPAAIASILHFKNSENTKILDNQHKIFSCDSPLTVANLSKADGDSKPASNSAPSAQASSQFSKATAHPESTRAACDSANIWCLESKLQSNFKSYLNQYSSLDPVQMSNKFDSAKLACQGDKSCQVSLDTAAASKQSRILTNLGVSLDSPSDPVGSKANKTTEKVYQKKINPCQCLLVEISRNLTRHFESSYFRTIQIGDLPCAQTISLNETMSEVCGQHYWSQLCGPLTFTAVSSHSRLFGSLAWTEHHPSTQVRGRRLANVPIPSGSCTGSPGDFNLLDTSVSAVQSYGRNDNMNTNARVGCDGVIQICYPTNNQAKAVGVCPIPSTVLTYWVATFPQSTWIQSILYIQYWNSVNVQVFVGDLSTNGYRDNQQCIGPMSFAGFFNCGRQGKYLALTSNTGNFGFVEVMAYSEFFIHPNAQSSILSSTMVNSTPTAAFSCWSGSCTALMVLTSNLRTKRQHGSCCIYSQEQTDPTLTVTFKADVAIKFVAIIPSDQCSTNVMIWQTNIEVWIKNNAGTQWQCGGLMADYNTYKEFPCNQVGNQIIVKRPGTAMQLSMAGTGMFSDCICSSSSFDPFLFTTLTSYAFSGLATDALKTVKVMPDTVSSVCGNADGYSYCPHSVSFIDSTGSPVALPLNGFSYDSATSVVTLNPAQALPFSRVTASVSIPGTSPLVTHTQKITWNLFKPSTPSATIIQSPSSTALSIAWVAPADGNSPITGYTVFIKKKDGTYTIYSPCTGTALTCTIAYSVLKQTPYNLAVGDSVYSKVLATNDIGSSATSPEGKGAVIPATEPSSPAAPTATILGNNALITWETPADGGSAITGYTVAIRQRDGVTFTALASCTGTTTSCLIPLLVLKAEPYNLAEGASIYATVAAKNFVGSSSASSTGSVAEITKTAKFIYLPDQSIDAAIGQEASLFLPEIIGVSYIVLSDPLYVVSLDGNLLKVKSDSVSDVGSHDLLIVAQTSTQSLIFTVDVTFKNLATYAENEATHADIASNTTITEGIPISVQDAGSFLKNTTSCTTNAAEILTCVTASGFSYSIDPNKMGKSGNSQEVRPTLSVSKVDTKGQFSFKFSQAMKTEALRNTTKGRHLQEKNITGQNDTSDKYAYLLSPKHLRIEFKSENTTKAKFTWYAKAITNTSIQMHVDFEDPVCISNEPQSLDRLEITVLPPALSYFQTIDSGVLINNPLQTFTQTLPPQVIPGKAFELVSKAAEIMEEGSQYAVAANLAAQLAVSGSMGQMWSMVNSFQILNSFNYLRTNVPGNVRDVMTHLNNMLELSALPIDKITSQVFNFTETQSPGAGFAEMGNDTKVLVLFIGKPFYIGVFILAIYILYGLVHFSGKSNKTCKKVGSWLATKFIFGAALRYQMETQLDFGLGTLLKFEEPNLKTGSDIFDFGLSIVSVICLLLLPFTQIICICKNKDQMDDRVFKQKWGSLYEGLKTFTPEQRATAIKMLCWFVFRRIMTALNLVELRNQTVWLQLTFNMWLCLADACLILHWSPYETKLRNIMEKFNGAVILLLSQLIYMQTDLILPPADRYQIGWYYLGVLGLMVLANFSVVIINTVIGLAEKFKKRLVQCQQIKARALQKENLALDLKGALPPGVVVDGSLLSRRSKLELEILRQLRKPEVDNLKLLYLQDILVAMYKNQLDDRKSNVFQENQSEIEMGSHRQAEFLVDQISEFTFYEKQKAEVVSSELSAIESESFEQSSNRDKSEQIALQSTPIASVRSKAELEMQPEEIYSTPRADQATELWKAIDQPKVADKNASTRKLETYEEQKVAAPINDKSTYFSNNQIVPAKKAKEPILLQSSNQALGQNQKMVPMKRIRKKQILQKFLTALDHEEEIKQQLSVEQAKDKKAELNQLKVYIFDTVMASLQAAGDPMVSSVWCNSEVRQDSHLLSDDIAYMSEKDKKTEVKYLLSVCPGSIYIQIKLRQHQEEITKLTEMEDLLKDVVQDKIAELDGLRKLVKFYKDKAARAPNNMLEVAKKEALDAIQRLNAKQRDIKEDQEEIKRLAADKACKRKNVDLLIKS